MVMGCCAADAPPVEVGLTGHVPGHLQANTWLEVTGRYTARLLADESTDAAIPYLDVIEVRQVAAARQPYEG